MPVIEPTSPAAVVPSEEGPCNWALDLSCCPDWSTFAPAVQSAATAWATYLLWTLTGRRYGPCSLSVRPCGPKCEGMGGYLTWPVGAPSSSGSGSPWMIPFVDNGIWRNCGCAGACSCRARCEVLLTGPVAVIDEVKIDGVVLDPSAYRLDNGSTLVRTDGECWPECQDMNVGPDDVGAFVVTYQQGVPVPRAGQIAAGKLACQFAKACAGDGDCVLPQELQSLTRNGVEVSVVDPSVLPESILTGIADVDRWVRAVNPASLSQRPRVLSPDLRPHRIVTP